MTPSDQPSDDDQGFAGSIVNDTEAAKVPNLAATKSDGLGCHAGKDALTAAARAAGKSEILDKYAADYRIHDHLARMLVERRNHFKPLRTVVNLMKAAPQEAVFATPPVPQVEDERSDEIGDQPASAGDTLTSSADLAITAGSA